MKVIPKRNQLEAPPTSSPIITSRRGSTHSSRGSVYGSPKIGVSWEEADHIPVATDVDHNIIATAISAEQNSFMDSGLIYSTKGLGSDRARYSLTSKASMFSNITPRHDLYDEIRHDPKNQWDDKLRQHIVESFQFPPNESRTKEYLSKYNWPLGLQNAILKACQRIPLRFFIIDDSGSMNVNDGRRILDTMHKSTKIINCTRWAELSQTLKFHAGLADAIGNVAEFRTLNTFHPVIIGLKQDDHGESLRSAYQKIDDVEPHGQTPLCEHITKVIVLLESVAPNLIKNNQKACVIIATDGLATDGNLIEAMRPLTRLPVWLIIRLCTNEPQVVEFWSNVDKELELNIDVIDDMEGEAKEIRVVNSWLSYGEPLHKFREFGSTCQEMDLLDEATLGKEQLRQVCALLLAGGNIKDIPHPDGDWPGFIRKVKHYNHQLGKVFCPVDKQMKSWIDISELRKVYQTSLYASCMIS